MKKNVSLMVMLGMVLAFGLVVVGCDDGNNNGGGKTEAEAIADVSNATTAAEMKKALEEGASALGINLTTYNTLTADQKTAVANAVLADKPYVNAAAIKVAFDAAVTAQVGVGNTVPAALQGTWRIKTGEFADNPFYDIVFTTNTITWSGDGPDSVKTVTGTHITIVIVGAGEDSFEYTLNGNIFRIKDGGGYWQEREKVE
jgi:hypothetical protein